MADAKFLSVNLKDIAKGFITAFTTAFITALYQLISTGHLPTPVEWKTTGLVGLVAGLGYLLKNVFTNSEDKFMKPEKK